eukprot:363833-Chlamydomonas_euryale.AAC.1
MSLANSREPGADAEPANCRQPGADAEPANSGEPGADAEPANCREPGADAEPGWPIVTHGNTKGVKTTASTLRGLICKGNLATQISLQQTKV